MIDTRVDTAIVGRSYLSFAHGIDRIKAGENVLLIDDIKCRLGPQFICDISLLEKSFLQNWGEHQNIDALFNIHQFLEVWPIYFIIGQRKIRLGSTPLENLVELGRKFSFCFEDGSKKNVLKELLNSKDAEFFDIRFEEYIRHLGKKLYYFTSLEDLNFNYLIQDSPQIVLKLFNLFTRSYRLKNEDSVNSNEIWSFRSFVYAANGIFHKKLYTELTDFELFHLFCRLLSPNFRLKHGAISKLVFEQFSSLGGHFKSSEVKEVQFEKRRPFAIELKSYEGIIRPTQIFYIGGNVDTKDLNLKKGLNFFQSIEVSFKINDKFFKDFNHQRYLISDHYKMGTTRPAVDMYIHCGKIKARIFRKAQEGLKTSFITDEIFKTLEEALKQNFLFSIPLKECITDFKTHLGEDLWQDQGISGDFSRDQIDLFIPSKNKLILSNSKGLNLKSLEYFGPLKGNPLGPLGLLLDLKLARPRVSKEQ